MKFLNKDMPTPVEQSKMSYMELFKVKGIRSAIFAGIFISAVGLVYFFVTGDVLSAPFAVFLFLIDVSYRTWKFKLIPMVDE
jgi:formate/nitrite transporter FocA (FNT family)